LAKRLAVHDVPDGEAGRPESLPKHLVEDPVVVWVQEGSVDEVANDLIVHENTKVESPRPRLTVVLGNEILTLAGQPLVDEFLILEVELSELGPPSVVVEPNVGHNESLIIRMIGCSLHDDAHDAPDELDEGGQTAERSEDCGHAQAGMIEPFWESVGSETPENHRHNAVTTGRSFRRSEALSERNSR
jgi:hypothetical protein